MSSGLLNISITGLNAAQAGLVTTGHNIANASTPGYNRQSIVQTSSTPVFTGSGYMGNGADVIDVQRVYNAFLTGQVLGAQTTAAQLQTYSTQINRLDNLLGDATTGLSPSLQSYFTALSTAAANPASLAARQSVLSSAQTLSGSFQTLNAQLSQMRSGVNTQISTSVASINSLATQLAKINQQIAEAPSGGAGNQQPNDLLDQRDQLISSLNQEIRVTTHAESDGSLSVFIGSGQPLVVGQQNYQLKTLPGGEDPADLQIGLVSGTNVTSIPESLINGGNLGGLLNYRSQTLDAVQNALGRIALSVTAAMNAQHQLGQDMNGKAGGNLFSPIGLTALPASANTGTGALSLNLTLSDYQVDFSGGNYNITRLSDGVSLGAFGSLPQMVDGVQISLAAGTPANGDSFLVTPAALAGQRVQALASNTGNARLDSSGSNLQTLTDSDYRLTLTGPNTFSLTRLSDNQIWTGNGASQAAAFADVMAQAGPQGFSASLTGTMATGDSFLLRPARDAAGSVALAVTDPRLLALGSPIRTSAAAANAGSATISAGKVSSAASLPAANVSLVFNGGTNSLQGFPAGTVTVTPPGGAPVQYTITGPADQVPYTSGAEISFGGVSFSIAGQPVNGDTFTAGSNPAGIADGRNAIALGDLQIANTMMDGSASFQGAYAQMVSEVGNQARAINVRLDAQNKLVQEGQDAIQSNSGVNLDEEGANLIRYQQAYQASAKIISIADKLFSQLLTLGQ